MIAERAALHIAPQVVQENSLDALQRGLHVVIAPGGVGGEEEAGGLPEGVSWGQRFRIGNVQSRAQQAAGAQHLRQGGAVHGAPTARVEQYRAGPHSQQPGLAHQARSLRGVGEGQGHHIGLGEQAIQRTQTVNLVKALYRAARAPAQPNNPLCPQGADQPGKVAADIAGTAHQHGFARQGANGSR